MDTRWFSDLDTAQPFYIFVHIPKTAGTTLRGIVDAQFGRKKVITYYNQQVVGGPGSFMVPAFGVDAFPEAILKKLIIEIAGLDAPMIHDEIADRAGSTRQ